MDLASPEPGLISGLYDHGNILWSSVVESEENHELTAKTSFGNTASRFAWFQSTNYSRRLIRFMQLVLCKASVISVLSVLT